MRGLDRGETVSCGQYLGLTRLRGQGLGYTVLSYVDADDEDVVNIIDLHGVVSVRLGRSVAADTIGRLAFG